ncbi:hypothetical protein GYH30_010932 [Glycine max]|uniref:WAT1-related protein n=2 Tax=Glycine subgen. Soja TaxID=1462606 RepID=K7KM02_SOYBN|nr:hypothetical protein GYH30_010932 [Glycine max]RZC18110.1 WAT1-related protein [Glycine soja]
MMEKLDWKASSTRAKSIGTLVTIAGTLIMSLYKGQAVINNNPPFKLFPQKLVSSMQFDWAFGALLLAAHSCFLTISYILAIRIVREYPAELVGLLRLGFNMELIAIGCNFCLMLWGLLFLGTVTNVDDHLRISGLGAS